MNPTREKPVWLVFRHEPPSVSFNARRKAPFNDLQLSTIFPAPLFVQEPAAAKPWGFICRHSFILQECSTETLIPGPGHWPFILGMNCLKTSFRRLHRGWDASTQH